MTPLISYEPKPVVATGKQDVSSTNEMCFSCHDGFVLDSRSIWKSDKHSHPVGIKPSKKLLFQLQRVKQFFPLMMRVKFIVEPVIQHMALTGIRMNQWYS